VAAFGPAEFSQIGIWEAPASFVGKPF